MASPLTECFPSASRGKSQTTLAMQNMSLAILQKSIFSDHLTLTSTAKQSYYREGSDQALTQSNVLLGAMEQGGFLFSGLA